MNPPMTPREKVARVVYYTVTRFDGDTVGTHLGLSSMIDASALTVDDERSIVMSVCEDIADSVLTALASGSGDHAELEVVAWRVKHPRHDAHRLCFVPAATDEAEPLVTAASAEALLAKNAALLDREKAALKECSEWARQAGEAIGKLETSEAAGIVEGWRDRATEAERKLAEAVGLLRRIEGMCPATCETSLAHDMAQIASEWLSKEAERG